jgi:hypothetical protein
LELSKEFPNHQIEGFDTPVFINANGDYYVREASYDRAWDRINSIIENRGRPDNGPYWYGSYPSNTNHGNVHTYHNGKLINSRIGR